MPDYDYTKHRRQYWQRYKPEVRRTLRTELRYFDVAEIEEEKLQVFMMKFDEQKEDNVPVKGVTLSMKDFLDHPETLEFMIQKLLGWWRKHIARKKSSESS